MKVGVYDLTGKKVKEIELPEQFSEEIRPDVIKKAVITAQKNKVQPYGTKPKAGRTSSAIFRGIRRGYGHSYNWGVSRLPRLMIRGGRRIGRVVNIPQAKGGPRAHPPKIFRVWKRRLNRKERRLAIRSALAALTKRELVLSRGHKVPEIDLPIVVVKDFENIKKTKEVIDLLLKLKLEEELKRASNKKIKAGKGKMRGRKYKKPKSILVVVSSLDKPITKAARNIPGVDVVGVRNLNAEILAPGAHLGRLALFSEEAIKKLKEEKLFF